MTIPSLFSSASGLQAHQRALDVVGDNLANVNTIGFKSQRIRFSTQFSEILRAASGPTGDLGGINPVQVGRGTQVAAVDTVLSQGALEPSTNPLDVAIQNDGLFVVRDRLGTFFTRAGAFSVDANSILVDSATGARVQRVGNVGEGTAVAPGFQTGGDSDIIIPFGATIPGRATTEVTFAGNLDAASAGPLREELTSTLAFTTGVAPATLAAVGTSLLNDLTQNTTDYVAGDTIQITGTRADGSAVNIDFGGAAFDLSTATVDDLIASIDSAFLSGSIGQGATARIDANGNILLRADTDGPAQLTVNLTDAAGNTGVTNFGNFQLTTDGRDGDTLTTAIVVFDDQGSPHTLTFSFEKQADNLWDLTASINPAVGTITGAGRDNLVQGITFNENGSFQSITGTSLAQVVSTRAPFTTGVVPATAPAAAATALNALTQNTVAYVAGDVINITGTDFDGTAINVAFGGGVTDLSTATLGGLVAAIDAAYIGATAALDANGNIVLAATTTGQGNLTLNLADAAVNTGQTTFGTTVETVRGTDGDANITFEINNLAGFGTPQNVTISLGAADTFVGVTQFGGFDSVAATEQDGFAPGSLVDVSVNSDGVINGVFDNGRIQQIAQLAIAVFRNPGGLERLSSNLLRASANSGVAVIGTAGTAGAGTVLGNSLETSNVDVAIEFTRLIIAQRGFQVNARAFITSDEVLEETANLKR